MRVLVVSCKNSCDYLTSCLWDGLQEVLGEENVVDAVNCPWLHKSGYERIESQEHQETIGHPAQWPVVRAISGTREGERLYVGGHYKHPFDLFLVHSVFLRDNGWPMVCEKKDWFAPSAKVAYVEGWDAAWQIEKPQIPVDAVFRKEIQVGLTIYPYDCHHLTFAAPSRCFLPGTESFERPIDLFFCGNPDACLPGKEVRWPMLQRVFNTRHHHKSIITTKSIGYDQYFNSLRASKFALCPSGADLTDSLRTMEAVACGAIPIFVGYPDFRRDTWFPNELCYNCTVDTLADHIDEALSHDQTERRKSLFEHAKKYHTTAARARQMLKVMGYEV